MGLDDDVKAVADNGGTFQSKLADSLRGLISANNERKSEIESLRGDHETLRKDHDAFQNSAERENDLRRNEIKSLEEKMLKENQVRSHFVNRNSAHSLEEYVVQVHVFRGREGHFA